ncbi:MAG: hypothetical protein KDK76_00255 [Chlamydiia bacterium]|nr:hypothetical protein [Chlamydiia bacterium]
MSNVSCYLPGGNQSITRKWMEHQPTEREFKMTCLAATVLIAAATLYTQNTYLIAGTICYITANQMKRDIGSPDQENNGTLALPFHTDGLPHYKKILNLIVFTAFAVKSLKESWVKPKAPITPTGWTFYILKAPLHYMAISHVIAFSGDELKPLGTALSKKVSQMNSEEEIRTTAVAIVALSAALIFTIPSLITFMGTATLSMICPAILASMKEKTDVKECFHLTKTSIHLAMLPALGGVIGWLIRHIKFGPKNHAPSLPFFAKMFYMFGFYAPDMIPQYMKLLSALYLARLTSNRDTTLDPKESIKNLFVQVFRQNPQYANLTPEQLNLMADQLVEVFITGTVTCLYKARSICDDIAWLSSEDLIRQSEEDNSERWSLRDRYFRLNDEIQQLVQIGEEELAANKQSELGELQQTLIDTWVRSWLQNSILEISECEDKSHVQSALEYKRFIQEFLNYYNQVMGTHVPEYVPRAINPRSKDTEIAELRARIENVKDVKVNGKFPQKAAAYILLTTVDNPTQQKKNHQLLAGWTHPDKSPTTRDLFEAVTEANEVLKSQN